MHQVIEQRPQEDDAPSTETQGTIFPSQGRGVLPPTPPLLENAEDLPEGCSPIRVMSFRDLFEDFNRDQDDELLPLELIEEGDVDRIEEAQRGEYVSGPR